MTNEEAKRIVDDCFSGIKPIIPDNATNGDVIMAMFSTVDTYFSNVIDMKLWWNAKYKGTGGIHCTCTDAEMISREDAEECKELMTDINGDTVYAVRMSEIRQLPPVTPQQKYGKWITDRCDIYICSKCNHTYTDLSGERYGMNYCPNCGCRMIDPQESEDKE